MRLLQCDDNGEYSLTSDLSAGQIPQYAILSHTWEDAEVLFSDVSSADNSWQTKAGFKKIKFCGEQAKRDGLQYFWVDTCCIDKGDIIELQTAINSMFRWYRNAEKCYVYLSDLKQEDGWEASFRKSRWFSRGWTLQELIAPASVEFFSVDWEILGTKESLEDDIRDITGIPASALRCSPLSDFPISERDAWVQRRETTHEEDMAYSLLGIFGVFMPLIYGEGRDNAFRRLKEEVRKDMKGVRHNDFSVPFYLSNIPEIQNFVARKQELVEIQRTLSSDGSRRVAVLQGLGGIGKTQLAIAYAKRYRDHYSAVFWLNAKDEISIKQSFVKIARQILQEHPTASRLSSVDIQGDEDKVVKAVKAWLGIPMNTRWLLVYDNYDNPRLANSPIPGDVDLRQFLPEAYQGSIIITTRLLQVNLGKIIAMKKLGSISDSLDLLSSMSGRSNLMDDPDAIRLVKELDGLPLALATAGTYLARASSSFKDYLRLYTKSWVTLHTTTPTLESYEDRTLCSTWLLSYNILQKRHNLAAKLLQWWAYFDNRDIWYELLRHTSSSSPAWMVELTQEELRFTEAMGALRDYGLVEMNAPDPNDIESAGYSIHNCVHSWTIHVLNQEWDPTLARLAISCVAAHIPSVDLAKSWLFQRRLLPHAKKCHSMIQNHEYRDLEWAFHSLGNFWHAQDRLQDAVEMYLRSLRGKEQTHGPNHISTLATLTALGNVYTDQNRLQEAEEVYLRALRGEEHAFGIDHASTLSTVNNLGYLYAEQGKLQEAKVMYLRALRGSELAHGPEHIQTLSTINNLGLLYKSQAMFEEAKEMYLRALRGYERVIGPDDIYRYRPALNTMRNLGDLLVVMGKPSDAHKEYTKAHAGLEALLGPSNTRVQQLRNTLSSLVLSTPGQHNGDNNLIRKQELVTSIARNSDPQQSREDEADKHTSGKIWRSMQRLAALVHRSPVSTKKGSDNMFGAAL